LLHRLAQRLDDLAFRAETALNSHLRQNQRRIADLSATVLRHDPRQALAQARERMLACRSRLDRLLERRLYASVSTLGSLQARLHSLSPLAVLDRGYALVLNAEGSLIRSVAQLTAGDRLTTRLSDGIFASRVETTTATTEAAARQVDTKVTRVKRRAPSKPSRTQ
jgi:exodeoxyribonuclease VII large subunit